MPSVMDLPSLMPWAEVNPYLKLHVDQLTEQAKSGDFIAEYVLDVWRTALEMPSPLTREMRLKVAKVLSMHRWVNDPQMTSTEQLIRYNACCGMLAELVEEKGWTLPRQENPHGT